METVEVIDPQAPDVSETPAVSSRPHYAYRPRPGGATRPEVSIVTVVDGAAGVFHETARCVLGQSFQHWEWLIVNDGSSDAGMLATLRPYRDLDPRIRVVDLPSHHGRDSARHAGCRAARTPYVFILDSGDLIEPTTLETGLWHVATHAEFAFANGFAVRLGPEPALWSRGDEKHETFLDRPFEGGFPRLRPRPLTPYETVRTDPVLDNPLEKAAGVRRVMLLFPRFIVGGADTFTIDLLTNPPGPPLERGGEESGPPLKRGQYTGPPSMFEAWPEDVIKEKSRIPARRTKSHPIHTDIRATLIPCSDMGDHKTYGFP